MSDLDLLFAWGHDDCDGTFAFHERLPAATVYACPVCGQHRVAQDDPAAAAAAMAELADALIAAADAAGASAPRWVTEFGTGYDVPEAILTEPGLGDVSWHNDACPAFGHNERDDDYVIWVEHPDPAQRELDGGRFSVTTANGEIVLYQGDDVDEALACYRELTAHA